MTDCIVVGGGLIGMLCARELKKSGLEVLLLDKGELGGESSWAGGGILSPLHPWQYPDEVNELAKVGHLAYPQVAQALFEESGVDPEYIRSGLLVLDSNEQEKAMAWAKKWSMNLTVLKGQKNLQDTVPGVASKYDQGLWMPEIAQMRNPRLVKAARGSLSALSVKFKEHVKVEGLNVVDGQIKGVVANGESYHAGRVIIAGGAWSQELLKDSGDVPDINPVKGQMILFKGRPGLLKSMILAGNRYLIPRKDGRILCGSTVEYSGFDKSTSDEARESLRRSAIEIFPAIETLELEHHWAGLRPGSPDGVPYIGGHKKIKGLYINSGHFRNGVILGIGSCRKLVTEIIQTN